jgi:hypothetical protein
MSLSIKEVPEDWKKVNISPNIRVYLLPQGPRIYPAAISHPVTGSFGGVFIASRWNDAVSHDFAFL